MNDFFEVTKAIGDNTIDEEQLTEELSIILDGEILKEYGDTIKVEKGCICIANVREEWLFEISVSSNGHDFTFSTDREHHVCFKGIDSGGIEDIFLMCRAALKDGCTPDNILYALLALNGFKANGDDYGKYKTPVEIIK